MHYCQGAGAALLLVVRTVFGLQRFACHSVFVPSAGDVLQNSEVIKIFKRKSKQNKKRHLHCFFLQTKSISQDMRHSVGKFIPSVLTGTMGLVELTNKVTFTATG